MVDLTRQELEAQEARQFEIDTMMYLLRTAQPGIVTGLDLARNTVDVQPAIQGKLRGQPAKSLPIVLSVPIAYYGAGDFVVTHKPAVGDTCLLIACDRSLSVWKQSGGVVDPVERRRHNLTDSVAFFGLNAFSGAYPAIKDGVDVRSRDGQTSLHLNDGHLALSIGGAPIFTATGGSVAFNVPITAPQATINGIVFTTHTHQGVTPGSGNTGVPNP